MPTYESLLHATRIRFASFTKDKAKRQLFTTDAADLFAEFLAGIPLTQRQHYTCRACQKFIDNFGGLVVIDPETGLQESPIWHEDHAPRELKKGVKNIIAKVAAAKVTGVFYPETVVLGQPKTGTWEHFSVEAWKWDGVIKEPHQAIAQKLEDHGTVLRALAEFSLEQLDQVVTLLESDTLYRSEALLGGATWLRNLSRMFRDRGHDRDKGNKFWAAIAAAPDGFCHPRSGMLGALLTDLSDRSLTFADVTKRFVDRMAPLQYRRPQAPPKEGNIAAAETIIAKLGAAGSLERRFARFEEIEQFSLWLPKAHRDQGTGVFDHLRSEVRITEKPGIVSGATKKITWAKFQETVLPTADSIEYFVHPNKSQYAAILTATNPDAPPIIQWDHEDNRNPFSHYLYPAGKYPNEWNLSSGSWVKVKAVTMQPCFWKRPELSQHQGLGVMFILDRCRDVDGGDAQLCLFPQILKSEFHGISSTIELFSRRGKLTGAAEASACGAILQKASDSWLCRVRVTGGGMSITYDLDRWD